MPEGAAVEIREMGERLRSSQLEYGAFDIKFTPGTMLDVEFLTQYLQLRFAADIARDGHKASSPSTDEALEGLIELESLSEALPELDLAQVRDDYQTLRGVEARLRMADHRADTTLPDDEDELAILARRLGYQGPDAARSLGAELEELTRRTLQAWQYIT